MSQMLILDTPLTDPKVVANAYVTSAQASYPVSNLYDLNRRRRVWRSAGYWIVAAGMNTIQFRDAVGVTKTATVAIANYTTDAAFLTAVQAAFTAAGVAVYTVSRDTTTSRIKIASDVSGGATVFQLVLTTSGAIATNMGFDVSADLTGATSYTADLLRIHDPTGERFVWDLGIPSNPTVFAAVGDRNVPLPISPGATIKLQASPTNAWNTPAFSVTLTYRDWILTYVNSAGIAPQAYRYWSLQIIDVDNPKLQVELGALALGTHTILSRGGPSNPFQIPAQDLSLRSVTESGQLLTSPRPKTQEFDMNWQALDIATFEALQKIWEVFGSTQAFFIVMDPAPAFSSDAGAWTKLIRFSGPPTPALPSHQNWSYTWKVREEL